MLSLLSSIIVNESFFGLARMALSPSKKYGDPQNIFSIRSMFDAKVSSTTALPIRRTNILRSVGFVLCMILVCSTDAFVAPSSLAFVSTPRYYSSHNSLEFHRLHQPSLSDFRISSSPSPSPSGMMMLKDLSFFVADVGGITIDEEGSAFTDQINLLDGPIVTMLGVFGVVVGALIGFKLLTDQMDSAIVQVLLDFEATMKESYPQRWQGDIRPQLEGLEGDIRQQKLVQIMEEIQATDPEFMSRVQQKMKQ